MNTLLYVGLALFAVGFIGFIISIIMERHYEIKLFELNQKLQKDEQWRKKHYKEKLEMRHLCKYKH